MKSFAMMVLGCKVNDYEATYLKTKLLEKYQEVSFKEKADIYVIYTCCVTNTAEAKTRKMLHHARNLNPNAYIVAVGCLCQIRSEITDFKDVDLIVGSSKKNQLFDLINNNIRGNYVEDLSNAKFEELNLNSYPGKSRAFLKIQDGCNQFCAYCTIPYSRGPERSGNFYSLINQAEILAENSKEIVLTGIHTGRYNDGQHNLYELLESLVQIKKLETIRLSSIELNEISDEIIQLMATNDKLAHHLHIPLQAGSDKILKLMNRPYNMEYYISRIEYIRKLIPDISISTDLIVGFPSENEDDFKETLTNLKRINFSFIHCFPYARKKGTKADLMDEQLDMNIKKQRLKTVLDLQKNITVSFKKQFINKTTKMLVEKMENEYCYGYTKEYIYVKALGRANIGDVVKVVINKQVNDEEVSGYVVE